jgi:AraC-like DNA-binding protein
MPANQNDGKSTLCSKAMMIYYCGYEKCESGHFFGPAIRSHYLLHFVISGKGEYRAAKKTYKICGGEVFLIKPGESTYYIADTCDPWEYMWVAFDGIEAPQLVKQIGLEGCYCGAVADPENFRSDLGGIIDEFKSGGNSEYKSLGFFYSAMSQLEQDTKASTFEEEYLAKAVQYIHNNYSYPIKISDISRFIGIDRSYLYKLFMSGKGISPKQYLSLVRINAAKAMLMTKRYSVAETALSCGFSDSASFCNQFRKVNGKTPTQCVREAEGTIMQEKEFT